MAGNREAQITFRANTSQFTQGIKQLENQLKTLRSELKLNATQLKGNSDSVDLLKQRQTLLATELAKSQEKVKLTSQKLEEAKKVFGENSTEVQNLTTQLNNAKNVEAAIQNELTGTNRAIKDQEQALKAEEGATKSFTAAVEAADNKLEGLSKELDLNSAQLDGAKDKTGLLKDRQKLLAEQSQTSADKVKALEKALDACGKEVGENSDEYNELKGKLVEAKTEQQKIQNAIKDTTKELKEQKGAAELAGEKLSEVGKGIEDAGKKVAIGSAAVAAAGVGAVKSSITFESAFAGVKKTVDEVYDANGNCTYSYQELEDGIRGLAKTIPATTTEISGVAEAAGQLGIKTEDVLGFTRVMIDMGESTNISSETAATSIAKFANITGLAADTTMSAEEKYSRLGSVIVDLGNNFATSEADIVAMSMNLASAGSQVGLTEPEILALSTALSSVGLEAQAGGTAFSKALIQMQLDVETNSEGLKDWANVAGMSADEFATAFREDAAGALEAFIIGLSNCGGESESAIKVLDDMGITETRLRDSLLRSANASDVFSDALKIGSEAWDENTALAEEANKRYETTESKLAILKNNAADVAIEFGQALLPTVQGVVEKLSDLCTWLQGMDEGTRNTIISVGGFIAILGPVLIGIGKIAQGVGAVIKVAGLFGSGFAKVGALISKIVPVISAVLAGPLAPIIAIVAAVAAVIAIFVLLWKNCEPFREFFINLWDAIKNAFSGFVDAVSGLVSSAVEKLKEIGSFLSDIWGGIVDSVTTAFETVKNVITFAVMLISSILQAAFDIITLPFRFIWENCKDTIIAVWDAIVSGVSTAIEAVSSVISSVLEVIKGVVTTVWEAIKTVITTVVNIIKTIITVYWNVISTVISTVVNTIKTVITTDIVQ